MLGRGTLPSGKSRLTVVTGWPGRGLSEPVRVFYNRRMRIFRTIVKGALLVGLACGLQTADVTAQTAPGNGTKAAPAAPSSAPASKYTPLHHTTQGSAERYYRLVWGVDTLTVRSVESGELIRFNYRVVDAAKAKVLSDKKSEPGLIDESAHVRLVVPSLEKVGQLRQSSTPEVGRSYWMAFSNKGGLVKRGDLVNIVIGNFHANGLAVE